jgi:transposase
VIDNQHKLSPSVIQTKQLRKLKLLVGQRKRLIKIRTIMKVPAKELKTLKDNFLSKSIETSSYKMVKQINNEIKVLERQIQETIKSCPDTKYKFGLITSVPGVGKVVAWELLIKTNLFHSICDPRKLACYAGVVPFGFQSGTSINKKPRVSVYADRALKKLLHLSALRVIQLEGEMRNYYLRKVDEGKNKMSVINAIRNKIVARVCATINNDRPYQKSLVLS